MTEGGGLDQSALKTPARTSMETIGDRWLKSGWPFLAVGFVAAFVVTMASANFALSPDGSGYLSIAFNLRNGIGYTFPDGSLVTFRGPVFPGLLALAGAAGSVFGATDVDSAIVASRVVLGLNAIATGWLTVRLTGSRLTGWAVALLAIVQPIPFLSGGSTLVPDGVAAMFILLAAIAVSRHPLSRSRLLVAVGLVGLATLTKESMALGGVALAAALLVRRLGGRTWLIAAIPAVAFGSFVALVLATGGLPLGYRDIWGDIASTVHAAHPRPMAMALLLALGAVILWLAISPDPGSGAIPAMMLSLGLGLLAYSAAVDFGVRNAVIGVYGLCAVLGVAGHDLWTRLRGRTSRVVVVTSSGLLLVSSLAPITAIWSSNPGPDAAWRNPAVGLAARWLAQERAGASVASTQTFATRLWVESGGAIRMLLLPTFKSELVDGFEDLSFVERSWWMGLVDEQPDGDDTLIGLNRATRGFGGYFSAATNASLADAGQGVIVLSGILTNYPAVPLFDGAPLLSIFEANPAFHRAYASAPSHLPAWIVAYDYEGPLPPIGPPTTSERVAEELSGLPPDWVVIDRTSFVGLLGRVLGDGTSAIRPGATR